MTSEEYFGEWLKVLDIKEAGKIIQRLKESKALICPQTEDIFKAFKMCQYRSLKVVMIAQDPYPTLKKIAQENSVFLKIPVATGIALANSSDTEERDFSPSLEVLKESVIDYTKPHGITIFDPSLEKWEKQGVLMLKLSTSCEAGRVGSHSLLWRPFIKTLITRLSQYNAGIVYVLMGTQAQSLEPYINTRFNHVIRCRHPAWYARQGEKMPHDIWDRINSIVFGQSGQKIEWYQEY